MQIMQRFPGLLLLIVLFFSNSSWAQPANDKCQAASEIVVGGGGFATGTFTSATFDISQATVEPGESFAPAIFVAGQSQKSMWYKFSIGSRRSLRVTLAQPSTMITAGDAGFTVYKTNTCLPGNDSLSAQLTPIETFGNTFHPCVEPGEYLVQVSSKQSANGPLYIQLEVDTPTTAPYDYTYTAYRFGVLNNLNTWVDYAVGCHSLEDPAEQCTALLNYREYDKTAWHTFTTPAYFDHLSILLSGANGSFSGGSRTFGYALYEGDARAAGISGLTMIGNCDTLMTDGFYAAYRRYGCELKPNTTYSVQLFFQKDFNQYIRLAIAKGGIDTTRAPRPVLSEMAASNRLGTLSQGTTTATDYFACNSRHEIHPCGTLLAAGGVRYGNTRYNLSTFYTFSLSQDASVQFSASIPSASCGALLVRVFRGDVTNNCNTLDTAADLAGWFLSTGTLNCLPAGDYTVQIMGTDSFYRHSYNYYTYYYLNVAQELCMFSNLGQQIRFSLSINHLRGNNNFRLHQPGAYDPVNNGQPVVTGQSYTTAPDTFGCAVTVFPDSSWMTTTTRKAMFRQVVVADSSVMAWSAFSNNLGYRLFGGDANDLAITQGKHSYPDVINGLTPYSRWMSYGDVVYACEQQTKICVVPDTYTFVTRGTDQHLGIADAPRLKMTTYTTRHYDAATVQDMGSIIDSVGGTSGTWNSDIDTFSCRNNAQTINGSAPCGNATKAIYRQFYLSRSSFVYISRSYSTCYDAAHNISLFSGRLSTDGFGGLTLVWQCFGSMSSQYNSNCGTLPEGWYTIVAYGSGSSYDDPAYPSGNNIDGGDVGKVSRIAVTINVDCKGPSYNRPYKAAIDTALRAPFQIRWNAAADTSAYPATGRSYTLPTEYFNCTVDTPFSAHAITGCQPTHNRVAYYVFELTQESYVRVAGVSLYAKIYNRDVRTDSASFHTLTPLQSCMANDQKIELCRLRPGVYTLVIFAGDNNICRSVTPVILVDKVGNSRFDHALNAYDFGLVPADSTYRKGAAGDINPLNPNRAPSHDFFYCTTGAQSTDPPESALACNLEYNSNIYNYPDTNNVIYSEHTTSFLRARRNLWYTFVIDKPGDVWVNVENRTPGRYDPYPFTVYRSNVSGTLPFSSLVSTGDVDSTILQGLTRVIRNDGYYPCAGRSDVSFYVDPCFMDSAERYYILVEDNGWNSMGLNNQVEVSVRVNPAPRSSVLYDHYSDAYDFGTLAPGPHAGGEDDFSCATWDSADPTASLSCARRTLWYKFTTTQNGRIRYRTSAAEYTQEHIRLYRETIPGDSTSAGLVYQVGDPVYVNSNNWSQNCIPAGTYYIILTGCYKDRQKARPYIDFDTIAPKYDHYSRAYDFGVVGAGTHLGGEDTYTCATADAADLRTYSSWGGILCIPPRTLWYKFTVPSGFTGNVNFRLRINGALRQYDPSDIGLYKEVIPGDSTSAGLVYQYAAFGPPSGWGNHCITEGIYYLMLTGCNHVTGEVIPEIQLVEQPGDFCTAPLVASVSGAGSSSATVTVTCHTIGTDYGEFSPTLTCPTGGLTQNYKSSWFRIDIAGTDTLDVTTYLTNSTDVTSAQIKYRMMTGTCNAMQEQSCVLDALTQNTYKCLAPGNSYYIQVFTPVSAKGTVRLNMSSVKHADSCAPMNECMSRANFIPSFNCADNDSALFTNYSTYGTAIRYLWDFGYGGATSAAVSPRYRYPVLPNDVTYSVRLIVTNQDCGNSDTVTRSITIPGRPGVNLGPDTAVCSGRDSVILRAASHAGSVYLWHDNSTDSVFAAYQPGQHTYHVSVSYNGCTVRDTVRLFIDSLPPGMVAVYSLCNEGDTVVLDAGRNRPDVTYTWNTGDTDSILIARNAGVFVAHIATAECMIRDSFVVLGRSGVSLLGDDTAVCIHPDSAYRLVITLPGVTSYLWQDGSTDSVYTVSRSGEYHVEIGMDDCVYRDTIRVNLLPLVHPVVTGDTTFCAGDSVLLDAGAGFVSWRWNTGDTTRTIWADTGGSYYVSAVNPAGCESASALFTVRKYDNPVVKIGATDTFACYGDTILVEGGTWAKYRWNTGDTTAQIKVSSSGSYSVVMTDWHGCRGYDTIRLYIGDPPVLESIDTVLCAGGIYTLPSGRDVQTTGVYRDTLRGAAGCDSLILTLDLLIRDRTDTLITEAICSGEILYGYSATGVYRDTFTGINGCDSVRTLDLTVHVETYATVMDTICAGDTLSGYYAAGVYYDTLINTHGCDSIRTLYLTIRPAVAGTVFTERICAGDTLFGHFATGTYYDTLVNAYGCDSIRTLYLTVKPVTGSVFRESICYGDSYMGYTSTGTYYDTFVNADNCDSIRTLHLTVHPATYSTMTRSICTGDTLFGYHVTGTYYDTFVNVNSCDSVRILNLTVHTVVYHSIDTAICSGMSYAGYRTSGTYTDTLVSAAHCDSIRTIRLTVHPLKDTVISASICSGSSFLGYTSSGTYTDVFRSSVGCDSTRMLHLTVNPSYYRDTMIAICEGTGIYLNGEYRTESGIFPDSMRTADGCDSVFTTTLVISSPAEPELDAEVWICPEDSVRLYPGNYSHYQWSTGAATQWIYARAPGVYSVRVWDVDECSKTDSVRLYHYASPHVEILMQEKEICRSDTVHLYAAGNLIYRWHDGQDLSGTGNDFYTYIFREQFVMLTGTDEHGCTATDSITLYSVVCCGDMYLPTGFTPDGDGLNDKFRVVTTAVFERFDLMIMDRWGGTVFRANDARHGWDGTRNGTPAGVGTYFYLLKAKCFEQDEPIVLKGEVTLIR